jgi:hypothetical protein
MLKAIIKNWITSSFGLLFMIIGYMYFWLYKENIDNCLSCIGFGISLLFVKDANNKSLSEEEIKKIKKLIS